MHLKRRKLEQNKIYSFFILLSITSISYNIYHAHRTLYCTQKKKKKKKKNSFKPVWPVTSLSPEEMKNYVKNMFLKMIKKKCFNVSGYIYGVSFVWLFCIGSRRTLITKYPPVHYMYIRLFMTLIMHGSVNWISYIIIYTLKDPFRGIQFYTVWDDVEKRNTSFCYMNELWMERDVIFHPYVKGLYS